MIRLSNYPQLQLLAWNRDKAIDLNEEEAFALYEANWRFVDPESLTETERALIEDLKSRFGKGHLNV